MNHFFSGKQNKTPARFDIQCAGRKNIERRPAQSLKKLENMAQP